MSDEHTEKLHDKLLDLLIDGWIYIVVGLGALVGYFGKRTLDNIQRMQGDHLTHHDYQELSDKIDTLHRRVDDLYKLLVHINGGKAP